MVMAGLELPPRDPCRPKEQLSRSSFELFHVHEGMFRVLEGVQGLLVEDSLMEVQGSNSPGMKGGIEWDCHMSSAHL
jgi:hypothetical protein